MIVQEFNGVVFSEEEGERLAKALGPKGKGLILRNHGLLTVGSTVDEACYLYTLMERSCQVQLLAEAAAANGLPRMQQGAAVPVVERAGARHEGPRVCLLWACCGQHMQRQAVVQQAEEPASRLSRQSDHLQDCLGWQLQGQLLAGAWLAQLSHPPEGGSGRQKGALTQAKVVYVPDSACHPLAHAPHDPHLLMSKLEKWGLPDSHSRR